MAMQPITSPSRATEIPLVAHPTIPDVVGARQHGHHPGLQRRPDVAADPGRVPVRHADR